MKHGEQVTQIGHTAWLLPHLDQGSSGRFLRRAGEDDEAAGWTEPVQPRDGFDVIDAGHDHVDHHEVGTRYGRQGTSLVAGRRCSHAVAKQVHHGSTRMVCSRFNPFSNTT